MMTIITTHLANCSLVGRLTGNGRPEGPATFRRLPRPISTPTAKIPITGWALAGGDSAGDDRARLACRRAVVALFVGAWIYQASSRDPRSNSVGMSITA
jgi:hypothetical protein